MMNILNNEPSEYSTHAIEILQTVGIYYENPTNEPIQVIITRLKEVIDHRFLDRFPDLKFILTATTGLDHIDQLECQKRSIRIISLQGEYQFLQSIPATAEHTITLMLSLFRNIPSAVADVKNGIWNRMEHKGNELKGKTLCILGMGRIGIQVANIASAFGMNIRSFDNKYTGDYFSSTNLNEALKGSDILSIHLPYNQETHELIGKNQISQMNSGIHLINTSRGQIIKEPDIVDCLLNGKVRGVAVDVLATEYDLGNSALWNYSQTTNDPHVIITPHIGGCTYESMAATEVFIAKKFLDSLDRA
ncbi:MAG: hypothetical protein CMM83_00965 [Rhodospirillales bacterium]|nr:hypothetical protein [Chloroflexota bacterium]MBS40288.1 hypothetical protein [Rhodospirillales bacterium]|tara:strand:- start:22370 stop:23284 length:915 start_codon:yes stop_codon:yes gene_type:complete